VARLAREVHRVDPALAEEIARRHDTNLVTLGIVAPPPTEPEPSPLERAAPLVDSVVCAAAEAMAMSPQSLRPALFAACERAAKLHLDIETMRAVLRPPPRAPIAKGSEKARAG
jgi:hypothetical protein